MDVAKLVTNSLFSYLYAGSSKQRVIVCDEKLKKIFGQRDQVGFLEIAGLISPHFKKAEN